MKGGVEMRYLSARDALMDLLNEFSGLSKEAIEVKSRGLSVEESIGNPDRQDFPLLSGKEVLVQAELMGEVGQAFTADPLEFTGTIQELLDKVQEDRIGEQALLVATLNAVARKLGKVNHTIHCLNNEPEQCAKYIADYIFAEHGVCKVGIIGYQPAILENLSQKLGAENVLVTDLNPKNIGDKRYGVAVLNGKTDTEYMAERGDVFLVTGTVLANGTGQKILKLLEGKPLYFYGTTAAAIAELNGYKRLCPMSK